MTKQRLMFVLAVLFCFGSATAWAATLDVLLRGLQEQAAGKTETGFWYDRLIAVEPVPLADGDLRVGVILHLEGGLPDLSLVPGLTVGSTTGRIATARLPLRSLPALAAIDGIAHISAARVLQPTLDVAIPAAGVDLVWNGAPAYTGEGVLVGVIDSGIDWRHDDFRNPDGTTRIKAIWDAFGTGSAPPDGFAYGAEWTESAINAALLGGPVVTQQDTDGHGTHVSGIAVGNGRASDGLYTGVAYASDILFCKPYDNGFPEDKTIDAMVYLVQQAEARQQPIAITMSLGGHFGAHDGTSAQEQVVDTLSGPGVVFCIAAGNEGEDFLAEAGPAAGHQFVLRVLEYEPNPGAGDDGWIVSVWYPGTANMSVSLGIGPDATDPIPPGTTASGNTGFGFITIDNASQGPDPANGDRLCLIQVDDRNGTPVAAADWTITVTGGTGTAHAWLVFSSMTAGFPNSNQSFSLGMPATAEAAVSVGAWKSRNSWTSIAGPVSYSAGTTWGDAPIGARAPFSSFGPTRDGRQKPDVSAPGMAIVAAYSQDQTPAAPNNLRIPGGRYWVTQGTSMATPLVCGIVGLMFEKNPNLTAAEVRSILRETAVRDAFTGPDPWTPGFGTGKVDAVAALAAVTGFVAADGDIDGDGRTTILDVILLVNHILDPIAHPLTTEQRAAADVFPAGGGDGLLNISDVTRIVAFILGTATPGRALPAAPPVTVAVGALEHSDGAWHVPVTVSGEHMAGFQFALALEGAVWLPDALPVAAEGGVSVAAATAGDQVRVLVYAPDNRLPAAGVTVRVPVQLPGGHDAAQASAEPRLAGLLVADPLGFAREVEIIRGAVALPPVRFVQISPNPARDSATLAFQLGRGQDVQVGIYDLRGRRLRAFALGQLGPGAHTVAWDGRDADGRNVAAGLYLVRLRTPEQQETRKLVLGR
jgi:subtilisin family serine protease